MVDAVDFEHGEEAFFFARGADLPGDEVAGLDGEAADLRGAEIDVLGGGQVAVSLGAQEAEAVGQDFEEAASVDRAAAFGGDAQDFKDEFGFLESADAFDSEIVRHGGEFLHGFLLHVGDVEIGRFFADGGRLLFGCGDVLFGIHGSRSGRIRGGVYGRGIRILLLELRLVLRRLISVAVRNEAAVVVIIVVIVPVVAAVLLTVVIVVEMAAVAVIVVVTVSVVVAPLVVVVASLIIVVVARLIIVFPLRIVFAGEIGGLVAEIDRLCGDGSGTRRVEPGAFLVRGLVFVLIRRGSLGWFDGNDGGGNEQIGLDVFRNRFDFGLRGGFAAADAAFRLRHRNGFQFQIQTSRFGRLLFERLFGGGGRRGFRFLAHFGRTASARFGRGIRVLGFRYGLRGDCLRNLLFVFVFHRLMFSGVAI